MNQKEFINKQRLNQTRVSTDVFDNSYQLSLIVNSNSNSCTLQKTIPLHSHQNQHKNQLKNLVSSSFRLLNPSNMTPNSQQQNRNVTYNNKPLAFGCSKQRKLHFYQNFDNKSLIDCKRPEFQSLIVKTHIKPKLQDQYKQNSPLLNSKQAKQTPKSRKLKIGFGVGSSLQRVSQVIHKNGLPGPGYYQLKQHTQNQRPKFHKKIIKVCSGSIFKSQPNQQKGNFIGPGYYDAPNFISHKQQYVFREKWKQKLSQKKNRTKQLFQKLNQDKINDKKRQQHEIFKKNLINNEDQLKKQNDYKKHIDNNYRHPFKVRRQHSQKPLRIELRDKTNNFLPKVQQIIHFSQNNFKGPSYKHMLSNSFVSKNDHAFQAHYYKPRQCEGEYIYIKAKQKHNERNNFK